MTYEISASGSPIGSNGGDVHEAGSYVDWPAIVAGAVFAAALSLIMFAFGGAVGLSMTSPYRGEGIGATWLAVIAGLWFVWVMVSSFGLGGYLAGRMRHRAGDATAPEVEARDGAHGLMVWAISVLFGAALAAAGVGGMLGVGGPVADRAVEVASQADVSYFADKLLRGAAIDAAAQQEIASIVTRSAAEGTIVEADRACVASMIAERTGMEAAEARARVESVMAEIDAARASSLAAAERARVTGVVMGFITAASLILGAAVAYATATLGGRHRDEGLGFDALLLGR